MLDLICYRHAEAASAIDKSSQLAFNRLQALVREVTDITLAITRPLTSLLPLDEWIVNECFEYTHERVFVVAQDLERNFRRFSVYTWMSTTSGGSQLTIHSSDPESVHEIVSESKWHSLWYFKGFALPSAPSSTITHLFKQAIEVDVYRVASQVIKEDVLSVAITKTVVSVAWKHAHPKTKPIIDMTASVRA